MLFRPTKTRLVKSVLADKSKPPYHKTSSSYAYSEPFCSQTLRDMNGLVVETRWFKFRFLNVFSKLGIRAAFSACFLISFSDLNMPSAGFAFFHCDSSNISPSLSAA
uniref:Phage terminase, large subunit n=1 Tax=uncultured marine virus TaxID=186617 RepID=A0A0F7L5G8_9VIRU|nr:phage terminase, large subunit [uncultured marine virus]